MATSGVRGTSAQSRENRPASDPPGFTFRISSGLKRIIGRDLITDEFVAIFELVKNSFDAHATRVDLVFADSKIVVADNGKGMSLDDIKDKWLFVAYSAKKDATEDAGYRDRIGAHRTRGFAGNKGVGRFSCDRLGEALEMQTRTSSAKSVEVMSINWSDFERDAKQEFTSVGLEHSRARSLRVPTGVPDHHHGTVLTIATLREDWPRAKLVKLRAALAKLINPFGATNDKFTIHLHAPAEAAEDKTQARTLPSAEQKALKVVNGPIRNFIFDTLKNKTTHLAVSLSSDGKSLTSVLTDRGALIYEIREPNPYPGLGTSNFTCNLFFLNRSAKHTFTQRMGVPPVEFGSIFLFRNGFRIYPIGDEGEDTFNIDRRKQQGFARFLGTRDVIGRIDIAGNDDIFREATSRNQGLIETPAYEALKQCFNLMCFRRLERYVVGVNWQDALDHDREDPSRLEGDSASARITAIVAQLAGTEGVILVRYNTHLVRILNERSDSFEDSLKHLDNLAEKSGDRALLSKLRTARARYEELQRAEAAAREAAERERAARQDADKRAARAKKGYEEEKKRNLFLTSLAGLDRETVEIMHHQIIIQAAAVNEVVKGQLGKLRAGVTPTKESLLSTFDYIFFQNQKILSTARFATRANFRLDSGTIKEDLAAYVVEYVERVAPIFSDSGIKVLARSKAKPFIRRFKPIEVCILVDNLVSNAGRADATTITFELESAAKDLSITVHDDGRGLDADIRDLDRLFEKGFSTTEGSGLGLFHVAQILDDMGGSIVAERGESGARFSIRIKTSKGS